jgi:hypothetical protein
MTRTTLYTAVPVALGALTSIRAEAIPARCVRFRPDRPNLTAVLERCQLPRSGRGLQVASGNALDS